MGNFDLVAFKVILGLFGELGIFPKGRFLKRYVFYSYDFLSTKLFIGVHCDSPHKTYIMKFEISIFNGKMKKKLISWNRVIAEQNGVKFGTRGYWSIYGVHCSRSFLVI